MRRVHGAAQPAAGPDAPHADPDHLAGVRLEAVCAAGREDVWVETTVNGL